MRRIAITFAATVSVVVLLFSYRTSTDQTPAAAGRPLGGGSQPTRTTSPATPATPGSSGGNGTFTGDAADTRYGPVQVEVVVAGGRITDVKALEYPTEARRSQSISQQALPMLRDEVLSAQSANIDTISGATYTSDAYAQSLQAALDQTGAASQSQ